MAAKSSRPKDPFDQWRAWLDRAERQMNKTLNEAMSSEQFGKAQGRLMEMMLGVQRTTNETARRYFETMNMPTRSDVLHLAERLDQIEQRLGSLEHSIARLAGGAPSTASPRPKPKRTKKPPVEDPSSDGPAAASAKKAKKTRKASKPKKKAKPRKPKGKSKSAGKTKKKSKRTTKSRSKARSSS